MVGINYSPETTGIAPYTTALASSAVDAGWPVRIVTGIPHYPAWEVTDSKYRSGSRWQEQVGQIPVTRLRHHVPANADFLGRMRMESEFMLRATHVIAQSRAGAIVGVTPSLSGAAAVVMAAGGRPVGIVVQDLTGIGAHESGSAGSVAASAIARAELAILRKADLVGVIAPRFGEILAGQGVDVDRIVDLRNFTHVEPVEMTAQSAREHLGWERDGTLVVHTGNTGMKQGLETVVATARIAEAQNSDVTFVLVGAGNQRKELDRLSKGLANLRMVDSVSSKDYPYVLAAANLLLVNERSGVKDMSLPSKLTSYASAGRPLIAAVEPDGITGRALAEDGAAELVAPGNPNALLTAVERLAADRMRQDSLAQAAQAMGRARYGREAAEARYVAFVERLMSS